MERLKVTYYAKITGIQATSYETLAEIYKNKQSIETLGITGLAFSTIYFAIL